MVRKVGDLAKLKVNIPQMPTVIIDLQRRLVFWCHNKIPATTKFRLYGSWLELEISFATYTRCEKVYNYRMHVGTSVVLVFNLEEVRII